MDQLRKEYDSIIYGSEIAEPPLTNFNDKRMFGKFPIYINIDAFKVVKDLIEVQVIKYTRVDSYKVINDTSRYFLTPEDQEKIVEKNFEDNMTILIHISA